MLLLNLHRRGAVRLLYPSCPFDRIHKGSVDILPLADVHGRGVGNNVGATVGTFIFITLRRLIIYYKHSIDAYVPFQVIWLEQIMIGVMLLMIIVFRPQGLMPEKPTKMRGLNYEKFQDELESKGVKIPKKRVKEKTFLQRLFRR